MELPSYPVLSKALKCPGEVAPTGTNLPQIVTLKGDLYSIMSSYLHLKCDICHLYRRI